MKPGGGPPQAPEEQVGLKDIALRAAIAAEKAVIKESWRRSGGIGQSPQFY